MNPWGGGIRRRFALTVMSLVILLTVAVAWVVVRLIQKNIYDAAAAGATRDSHSLKKLHSLRANELLTRARLLAAEPKIIAVLGTRDIDRATVQHLADEIRSDGNLDVLMIAGAHGKIPVLSMKGFFDPPIAEIAPPGPNGTGGFLTVLDRKVFAVSARVEIQESPLGSVTIGEFVEETYLPNLHSLLHGDVLLMTLEDSRPHRIIAGTLPRVSGADIALIQSGWSQALDAAHPMVLHSDADGHLVRAVVLAADAAGIVLYSLAPVRHAAVSALKRVIAVAVCALVVSALIVAWMARAITQPIRELAAGTEGIAAGRYDVRTDIQGPDELRQLSQSFNSMAQRVQQMLLAEERAKAGLEQRVRERTTELTEANRMLVQAHHDLKEQTSRLVQYEKLAGVGTLAAGIAHELNNPLSVISGYAHILLDTSPDAEIQRKARAMMAYANRCADIVKSLLRFARQEGPRRKAVNVIEVIGSAIQMVVMESRYKNISVVKQLDPSIPILSLDSDLMEQVILNIVTNAFQAMMDQRGRGTLKIVADRVETRVRIRFVDDGPGIPIAVAARIFDPFFSTKGVGKGIGLGLSVALGIVEQHGGRIYVEKTGPDGTTLTLELPVPSDQPPAADSPAGPSKSQSAGDGAGRRALILDDETDIRFIMGDCLMKAGYDVVHAEHGEEALQKIESGLSFDVLFVDIRMAGMDGIEFYRQLTIHNPELTDRVVFVTGDTLSADVRHFLENNQCVSIIKPFKMQELLAAARTVGQNRAQSGGIDPTKGK